MRLWTAKLQQPQHRHSTQTLLLLLLLVMTVPLAQTPRTLGMLPVPMATQSSRTPSRLLQLLLLKAARQHKLWAPSSSQPTAVVVSRTRQHCPKQQLGSKQSSSRNNAHRRRRVSSQSLPSRRHRMRRRSLPSSMWLLHSRLSMRPSRMCRRQQDRVSEQE